MYTILIVYYITKKAHISHKSIAYNLSKKFLKPTSDFYLLISLFSATLRFICCMLAFDSVVIYRTSLCLNLYYSL